MCEYGRDKHQLSGLSEQEARRRLREVGPNEPVQGRRVGTVGRLLAPLANPLSLLLLTAAGASALVGEQVNAAIIVAMVMLSSALSYVQIYRSHRAIEQLRAQAIPTAKVMRDGTWRVVPRREVVPGDLVRLVAGDPVPADGWLLTSEGLQVQESVLTGESLPVEKPPGRDSHVYLGTYVVSGSGIMCVTATGARTQFGEIAARLSERQPETEFERGLRTFSLLIMRVILFLVGFVLLASLLRRRDPLEALLFSVALAVGLTPEFLPMVTTIALAYGAMRMASRRVIVKHLPAIQNLGSIDMLCSDKTGTLTTGEMRLVEHLDALGSPSDRVLELAFLNSYYSAGADNPLDAAILAQVKSPAPSYIKLGEVPFDFDRRRLSVMLEGSEGYLLVTKGAPESVLPICSSYEMDGEVLSLDEAVREHCLAVPKRLGALGYRTLAVSYRLADRPTQLAEAELVLAGFLAFLDPPLDDAGSSIATLAADGVKVKILTGDSELVAKHVCASVGIDASRIVLGTQVDALDDAGLGRLAEDVQVFARVSPAQKSRIILALRGRGHVVGYLGDGINDAPALRNADVGISAAKGTEVAKDAADVVLSERSLRVLHEGIVHGRRAFGNVMKYILMGTSSNFGNVVSMAAAALLLPFLPLLPTQVLLNNFLYDLAQVSIPTDNVDPTFVRKPRRWDVGLVQEFMLVMGPVSSGFDLLTFAVLLKLFHSSERMFHTGWFVESLATQTLVVLVIRTFGNPLASRPSKPLAATVASVVLLGMALPYSSLAGKLGFVPLPAGYLLIMACLVAAYLSVTELVKRWLYSRHLGRPQNSTLQGQPDREGRA